MPRNASERGKGGNFKRTPIEQERVATGKAPNPFEHKGFMLAIRRVYEMQAWFSVVQTRDGGAFKLTVLANNEKLETFITSGAELDECSLALRDMFPTGIRALENEMQA